MENISSNNAKIDNFKFQGKQESEMLKNSEIIITKIDEEKNTIIFEYKHENQTKLFETILPKKHIDTILNGDTSSKQAIAKTLITLAKIMHMNDAKIGKFSKNSTELSNEKDQKIDVSNQQWIRIKRNEQGNQTKSIPDKVNSVIDKMNKTTTKENSLKNIHNPQPDIIIKTSPQNPLTSTIPIPPPLPNYQLASKPNNASLNETVELKGPYHNLTKEKLNKIINDAKTNVESKLKEKTEERIKYLEEYEKQKTTLQTKLGESQNKEKIDKESLQKEFDEIKKTIADKTQNNEKLKQETSNLQLDLSQEQLAKELVNKDFEKDNPINKLQSNANFPNIEIDVNKFKALKENATKLILKEFLDNNDEYIKKLLITNPIDMELHKLEQSKKKLDEFQIPQQIPTDNKQKEKLNKEIEELLLSANSTDDSNAKINSLFSPSKAPQIVLKDANKEILDAKIGSPKKNEEKIQQLKQQFNTQNESDFERTMANWYIQKGHNATGRFERRTRKPLSEQNLRHALTNKLFDDILAKQSTTQKCQVFRGVTLPFFLQKGDLLHDCGVMSTTFDPKVPLAYNHDKTKPGNIEYFFDIEIPEKSTACFLSLIGQPTKEECELLLPANSKLEIVDVTYKQMADFGSLEGFSEGNLKNKNPKQQINYVKATLLPSEK